MFKALNQRMSPIPFQRMLIARPTSHHRPISARWAADRAWPDTPQSVTIVPESLIENAEAQTVNDCLRYLPSVEVRDQQGSEVSRPQSRGFEGSIVQNVRLDGLNYIGTSAIDCENLRGVEVLNGLAGALYGPESPSGVFNYLLKHPTDQSFFTYREDYDSQSIFTEQIDAGGRVGQDGRLGYRVNIVHGAGEGYVDDSKTDRTLGSIDLDYRFDNNTDVEAYYGHYATDITGMPGEIVFGSSQTSKTNHSTFLPQAVNPTQPGLGQPGAGDNLVSDTGMLKIRHEINQNWNFEAGGLYENANRGLFGITDILQDNSGNYNVVKNFTAVPRFTVGSNSAYLNGRVWLYGMKTMLRLAPTVSSTVSTITIRQLRRRRSARATSLRRQCLPRFQASRRTGRNMKRERFFHSQSSPGIHSISIGSGRSSGIEYSMDPLSRALIRQAQPRVRRAPTRLSARRLA